MTQFTVKPLTDVISDLLLNVFNNIPDVTDANVGGVLRQMLEAVGQEISLLYDQLQLIYNGSRVDFAESTDLDQIGLLVGITRKAGTKASGNITFFRNQTSPSNFTIAANSLVSLQPNTGETQLRYKVVAVTTFFSAIAGESNLFRDGIYDYALDERLIDSIQMLKGTVLTIPNTPLTLTTDYVIVEDIENGRLVDVTLLNSVDRCEVITGWTNNADATVVATDAVNFREGTKSLKLGKSGVASNTARYEKVFTPVINGKDRDFHMWFRILDTTTLNKIDRLEITYGSGGTSANSKKFTIERADLVTGFQLLRIDRNDSTIITTGVPSLSAINFVRIDVITNNIADTIVNTNLNMDFLFFAPDSEYNGDLVRFTFTGTSPDDNTNFLTDYKPLSREVLCEAEAVGDEYNVSKNKIIFKVSSIPSVDHVNNFINIGGGTDVELDTDLRERIKNAVFLIGKATVNALRQAALGVDGITSVTVNDLPQKTSISEPHRFLTGTDNYQLNFEIAQSDGTLTVIGTDLTIFPTTFISGTDYVLNELSEVVWQTLGNKPDNNTDFFTTYNYKWLGHVEIFVSGVESPLPVLVLTNVTTVIDDTRAAGIDVDIFEPTIVNVSVTATVIVESGFSVTAVKSAVADNVTNFLNSLPVGQDVFRAELIRVIQETSGVENSTLTVPAADVVIGVNQIAKAGVITIL